MRYTVYKNDFNAAIKKLCIFCTYLHTSKLPYYILHYIDALKKAGYEVIVVSHSPIEPEDLSELEKRTCGIILKENFGYDFFAWRQGLNLCENIADLDDLLLTNDSIIGPFADMKPIFDSMQEYDFWGLTENYEHSYHIQSYFLHANRKVLASSEWISFWDELKLFDDKLDIVKNYEVKLTQSLNKNKHLRIGAWVDTKALADNFTLSWFADYPEASYWYGVSNPAIRFWKELLQDFKFPFIKKNLFFNKEHYHVVKSSNKYEYLVFPTGWKKCVERSFGRAASMLVEEFIREQNISTTKFKHYINEKYKLVFIYDSLRNAAQIDYLVRLLQFFNKNSVETEVILSVSEDSMDKTDKSRLRDLTTLTFFQDLSGLQADIHLNQLSTEKIGALFIGNVTAVKFAAKFAFTSCPYVAMITDGAADTDYLQKAGINIRKENLLLMTPSEKAGQWLKQNGFESHLIDFFPVQEKSLPGAANAIPTQPSANLGLIFTSLSESNYEQILRTAAQLNKQGDYQLLLLFRQPEFEKFKAAVKANSHYESFLKDSRYKIIVYESLKEVLAENDIDIFLSYQKSNFVPAEYADILSESKLLLTCCTSPETEEIFGESEGLFAMDYFNIPGLVEKITRLKSDPTLYPSMVARQTAAFQRYRDLFPEKKLQEFFFTKAADFSELYALSPKITVIFHFHFYSFDETTFLYYKKRLREFYKPNVNFLFSITEDSYDIPEHVRSLQEAFPASVVKIVPNKGRDIGAKFILFDYFLRVRGESEFVVVLHDKKSLHLPYGEARAWIDSLLKIIDPRYYQSILGTFNREQQTGIIGSSERIVDCILRYEGGVTKKPVFEWNNDLLHYMITQYDIKITDYNFVGGTMFWIKGDLLKKLNEKYNFLAEYGKLEEGNVMDNNGSTITHCWERLFCWLSTNSGYQVGKI